MATTPADVESIVQSVLSSAYIAVCEARTQTYVDAIKAAIPLVLTSTNLAIKSMNAGPDAPSTVTKMPGKVRDVYDDGEHVTIVTTDRLTAFDRPIANIPGKGQVLNKVSEYWFRETAHIMRNHLVV
jgi:phosphoribosylaminoimidazole-succinocarboxamide synthase